MKPGTMTATSTATRASSAGPATRASLATISIDAKFRCTSGSSEASTCGVGNYSTSAADVCSKCEPGHYCGSNTTTMADMYALGGDWMTSHDMAGRCFNGTWCPPGMRRAPDLVRDPCPTGYYCPTATEYPLPCPAGTYMPTTGADAVDDCLPTPRGYYTVEGASNYTELCDPGYYCPLGSTSPTQVPCPSRFYLPDSGGRTLGDCALCTAGGFCPNASATPTPCPKGYFCSTGVSRPEPCRPGTFGNGTGLRRTEDCTPCLPGSYCDGYGLNAPRGPCDPGYYCLEMSHTSAPHAPGSTLSQLAEPSVIGGLCPSGGYCPAGSSEPTKCPSGTYNNYTGATSPSDCKSCEPGYYCAGSSNPFPSGKCEAGFYCSGGSNTSTQFKVPKGHFSIEGASAPSPCVPGTYQPFIGQSFCLNCDPGYFCSAFNTTDPTPCPEGSYCEESTVHPEKCPSGTYGTKMKLNSTIFCTKCPAGSFCEEAGLTVETTEPCAAGFWCGAGSSREKPVDQYNAEGEKNGDICPPGHFCPAGDGDNPRPCPRGTFYPGEGATGNSSAYVCEPCWPGYACNATGLPLPKLECEPGYFCARGATNSTPDDYGGLDDVGCTADTWELCDYGPCPPGYECAAATGQPVACAAGTYAPNASMTTCLECPASQYCDGVSTAITLDCPRGNYCPRGSALPPPTCPQGTTRSSLLCH